MDTGTLDTEKSERRWRPLTSIQRRIAGVLVEKAKTTPDAYPLTLNALTNGCNQKSNRDPHMDLSAEDVERAVEELREMGALTNIVSGTGTAITYDFVDPDGNNRRSTLAWAGVGQPLTLNTIPLSDDVALFALRYYTSPGATPASIWNTSMRQLEIVLQSATAGSMIYSNRLAFRTF